MSYQRVIGTLSANTHPGSYCGQDAYNDMFVTERRNENGLLHRQWTEEPNEPTEQGRCVELYARSTSNIEGGSSVETVVRRLTPTECERLQGFPDGWTDIGEWTDTKGKIHKESSDSARYKALGNSIATPFWFWLLRRISAQYDGPATLGSLFDGIGGFPYCWVRCNGTDSVLWSSEIEEFPIAVVKRHFGDEDAGVEGDVREYL